MAEGGGGEGLRWRNSDGESLAAGYNEDCAPFNCNGTGSDSVRGCMFLVAGLLMTACVWLRPCIHV